MQESNSVDGGDDFDADPVLPSLENLVIQSSDTLRETQIDMMIAQGWSGTMPILQGPRGQPETTNLLKGVLRRGVPPALRCAVWVSNVIQAVRPHQEPQHWYEYRTLAMVRSLDFAYENLLRTMVVGIESSDNNNNNNDSNGNGDIFALTKELWQERRTPTYGQGSDAAKMDGVTAKGEMALKRVLIALEHVLGIIEFCPILPTLAALLLTNMSESYAFTAIREMVHDTVWYFPISKREHLAYCYAFSNILHKLHKQTAEYLEDRMVLEPESLEKIFQNFFVGVLPLHLVHRIVDIYTLEGSKVLFRVGVALFVLYKREAAEKLVTISNAQEWWHTLSHWAHHKLFNFDVVLRKAYGVHGRLMRTQLRFPSRTLLQRIIKSEEWRLQQEGVDDGDGAAFQATPLGLTDRQEKIEVTGHVMESVKPTLAQPMAVRQALANWVPITMRLTNLDLIYSTNYHGRSLELFYQRVKNARHSILLAEVLLDDNSHDVSTNTATENGKETKPTPTVIGMYASQAWRISNQVYGDGECFLFRASPNARCWKWRPEPEDKGSNSLEDFAQDAILHQFMVSRENFISMGGNPDGSCGLRLDEDLTTGESSAAVGFGNEPLHGVGRGSVFSIGLLEVYGLVRQIDGKSV